MSDPFDYQQQNFKKQWEALCRLPLLTRNSPHQIDKTWLRRFYHDLPNFRSPLYLGANRLGFYYQWLWKQALLHHPRYQYIMDEIGIYDKKRTLGSVDFVVFDRDERRFEHWEVAVKFYLYQDGEWVGTNKKDKFEKKRSRMITHQLNLLDGKDWRNTKVYVPKITKKRLILQGILFSSTDESPVLPTWANSTALQGHWYHEKNAPNALIPLSKAEWLTASPIKIQQNRKIPYQSIDSDQQRIMIVPNEW